METFVRVFKRNPGPRDELIPPENKDNSGRMNILGKSHCSLNMFSKVLECVIINLHNRNN